MPLFAPLVLTSVPLTLKNLVDGHIVGLSAITLVLSLIVWISFILLLNFFIVPRVLLEDIPIHEWLPLLAVLSVTNSSLLSFYSSLSACLLGRYASIASFLMFLQSLACGIAVFRVSSTPKRKTSVLVGTIGISGAVIALIQTINILSRGAINPDVVLIISFIILVLIFIILHRINHRMILQVLHFFDECIENTENLDELLNETITTPLIFLGYMRSTMEYCHPFFVSMIPFQYAMKRWPNSPFVSLYYARVLSFFPSKNSQMLEAAFHLLELPYFKHYTSYVLQFRHISRTRQTLCTPQIKKQIDSIRLQCEDLSKHMLRFWENVLQKNSSNFWDDVQKVNKHSKEIEYKLRQMQDDYPNNETVLWELIRFITKYKNDYEEYSFERARFENLRVAGFIKPDLALTTLHKVFPTFSDIKELKTQLRNESTSFYGYQTHDDLTNTTNSFSREEDIQIEIAVEKLIKRSKLGKIWFGMIFISITTIISILLYCFYHQVYTKTFLLRESDGLVFLTALDQTIYQFSNIAFFVMIYPILFEGYPGSLPANFMEQVAPTLYPNYISAINLSDQYILENINVLTTYSSLLKSSFETLDQSDPNTVILNELLTNFMALDEQTPLDLIDQIPTICKALITYSSPDSYYQSSEYSQFMDEYENLFYIFNLIAFYAYQYCAIISEDNIKFFNLMLVLVIIGSELLVNLPFLCILFKKKKQSSEIADSFTYISNTDIRAIINEFDKSLLSSEEDASAIAKIGHLASMKNKVFIHQVIVFLFLFLPPLICAFATYYLCGSFLDAIDRIASKIYYLYPSFGQLTSAAGSLIKAALIDTDNSTYLGTNENFEFFYNEVAYLIDFASTSFSMGLWGDVEGALDYYSSGIVIDTFTDAFPVNYTSISSPMSYFEIFATEDFPTSIDVIIGSIKRYLFSASIFSHEFNINDNLILSLIYWFGYFSNFNRTNIYFDIVENVAFEEINYFESNENVLLVITIVFQVFALILVILLFFKRQSIISESLRLYLFINPSSLLNNPNAISLIENGSMVTDKTKSSYSNSEFVVKVITHGIVIINKNREIVDYNPAFENIIQQGNINGNLINDVIKSNSDNSWDNFMDDIIQCLSGTGPLTFKKDITGMLHDGQSCHFACTAIALNSRGKAEKGDPYPIEKVIIIFEDNTQAYLRRQILEKEQEWTKNILSKVLPDQLISLYENHKCESLSFAVQNISVGHILVKADIDNDKKINKPFHLFEEIWRTFDEEIKNFDLLSKVRISGNIYTFAGGLFNEAVKSSRNAEQAAMFSLQVMMHAERLSKKYGVNIEFVVAIHADGPAIVGVMENQKPTLQIIGLVMDISKQILFNGVPNKIQVTRNVYELIFIAGFHFIERGEIEIRNGEKLLTYLLNSK